MLLYPEHNYCRIEDPRMGTVIECRFDEVTRLNDALVFYQLMFVPLTGTVGNTGPEGTKGTR